MARLHRESPTASHGDGRHVQAVRPASANSHRFAWGWKPVGVRTTGPDVFASTEGARYLVFTRNTFRWLEHSLAFRAYLEARDRRVHETEAYLIFNLGR